MKWKAECTWGDGPPVILSNGEHIFDLSKEEAKQLACDLMIAVNSCEELDNICEYQEEWWDDSKKPWDEICGGL